jgi:hypothetical protein
MQGQRFVVLRGDKSFARWDFAYLVKCKEAIISPGLDEAVDDPSVLLSGVPWSASEM